MVDRRHLLQLAVAGASASALLDPSPVLHAAEPAPSFADQLNQPGEEAQRLARRVGLWTVTETAWATPGAAPAITTGLVAERMMLGSLLQEFIRPPTDTARADVKRTDMLCFNRLDGRWDYVSFDTRAPVGLMPAWSAGPEAPDLIEVSFAPFAVPGAGHDGLLLRMRQQIIATGADRDRKDQYFTLADGTGTEWLAHRYDYARQT